MDNHPAADISKLNANNGIQLSASDLEAEGEKIADKIHRF